MLFYRQPNYIGNGCAGYDSMEFKHNDDIGKIFFIYSEFSTKCPIEFNATFEHSPNEILDQLHKPRKPRRAEDIISLMHDESV